MNNHFFHCIFLNLPDLLNTSLSNTELGYMEASDKCKLIYAAMTLFNRLIQLT